MSVKTSKLMKIVYIAPAPIPSRSANSIHVLLQCKALIKFSNDIVLYTKRTVRKKSKMKETLMDAYGIDTGSLRLVTTWNMLDKFNTIQIALLAIIHLLINKWPDIIISRNLYASFVIVIIYRKPILFETHQLEYGFRKYLQNKIIRSKHTTTILISEELKKLIIEHHKLFKLKNIVLHDAAQDGVEPISRDMRRNLLYEVYPKLSNNWDGICGYFGHLYSGRGIEQIAEMANKRPNVLFLIFGGNQEDVDAKKRLNRNDNMIYMGHVPHSNSQYLMKLFDILLMPYQKKVSIGVKGHDTGRWMSPMKMFEYMATGVPIISSNLTVLREILKNNINALLVSPDNSDEWVLAIDKLIQDKAFSEKIGMQSHKDYKNLYTWSRRAKCIVDINPLQ